jgi:hypothetical protein
MTDDRLVIRDIAALRAWQQQVHDIVRPERLSAVDFELAELAVDDNQRFSRLANHYQQACGCTSGGVFMAVAVVAMLGYYLATGGLTNLGARQAGHVIGTVVLAALLGKLAGLGWARWQLLRLAASVQRAVNHVAAIRST